MSDSDILRKCVDAIANYQRDPSEANIKNVLDNFEIIIKCNSCQVFDPVSTVATNFYVRFHKFLADLDSSCTSLVYQALNVTQRICQNEQAKNELVNKLKIISVITKFITEKSYCVNDFNILHLLAQLTYGMKIVWQETHLHNLIVTLVQIILNGKQDEKSYGLEILVNLCYKNLPVLYLLTKKCEVNKFIVSIAKMNNSPIERLHVCKMMIIFQQIKGHLPDADIINLVDLTFVNVREAYQRQDYQLLKTAIDFFRDVSEDEHYIHVLPKYTKCAEDTRQILDLIDVNQCGDQPRTCVPFILDFACCFVAANLQKTAKYIPRLVDCSIKYLEYSETTVASLKVLDVVTKALKSPQCPNGESGIMQRLTLALTVIINIADSMERDIYVSRISKQTFVYLLKVLISMSCVPELLSQVVLHVRLESIQRIVNVLLQDERNECTSICGVDEMELGVSLLVLISKLAALQDDWKKLLSEILTDKRMITLLAKSFYDGNKEVKSNIFEFVGTARLERSVIETFSEIMCEIRPSPFHPAKLDQSYAASRLLSGQQESRVDELIDGLRAEREAGRIADASTASIMELYDYKVSTLGAEIEAADQTCIRLNHQVAQLQAQVTHLLNQIFTSQQCVDGLVLEKNDFMKKLKTMSEQNNLEKNQHSRQLKELKAHVQQLEKGMRSRDAELASLMAAKEQITSECATLKASLSETEEKYQVLEKVNSETIEKLDKADEHIKEYQQKLLDVQHTLSECKTDINDKDNEIAGYLKRIEELETMQKIIYNVVAVSKKDHTNESH